MPVGTIIAGKYTLLEKVGEGGMGEVWVARQTEPVKRKVALKLIKPGMDSKAVLQRFEQERQALALMDHPNIARVYDGGLTADRRPFFVMELVNGLPLTRFCDEARMTLRQRLELFIPVCQAVQHAHQKGVVHRDLKPSNILVTLYDGKPVPKVIDFGVAKATGGKLTDESLSTNFGAVVGTLEYMAPEQAGLSALDVDTRADIYSLGVLLYELLTGLRPIGAERLRQAALDEAVRILREEEPSRPSTRLSTAETLPSLAALRQTEPRKLMALLRGELDWVVMKCLEKQRDHRYETANGLARDLQRYIADEPVEARPPSARYRLGKFLLRHRGPVLAAGLVLLALVLGMAGTTWGMLRADSARQAEVKEREAAVAARELAEQRFELAQASVDRYLNQITQDPDLKDRHDLNRLRKKLLETAMPFYQKLAEQKPEDAEQEAARGQAFHRLGKVQEAVGDRDAARVSYEHMRAIFARLAADFATVPAYRQQLARSEGAWGNLLWSREAWPEARAALERALKIQAALAAEFPAVPDYRKELAGSHISLGLVLGTSPETWPAARAEYEQARKILELLAAEFPAVPDYRFDLARSYNNLGVVLWKQGDRPAATSAYAEAVKLYERLAAESPAVPVYRRNLAGSRMNLANELGNSGRLREAREQHEQAIRTLEKLAADFPSVPGYRIELGGSYCNYGNLWKAEEKPAAALEWYDKAQAALESALRQVGRDSQARPFLINVYQNRAATLDQLGNSIDAVRDWDRALELDDGSRAADLRRWKALSLAHAGAKGPAVRTGNQREPVAGRTKEALRLLARAVAADPKKTELSLQLAALQAWFGQDKELAVTRERISAFAKDTREWTTGERAAKACSLAPSGSQAEREAALALARKGVELDAEGNWRKYTLLALGMAEYRCGHYAAADKTLVASSRAAPDDLTNNAQVTGTAAFYRAMSLFRQGKKDEARKLALAAAGRMKPLPKDEQNPLVSNATHDDLILWLAYKEAKALIRFDERTAERAP